jgi:hypothetical protein
MDVMSIQYPANPTLFSQTHRTNYFCMMEIKLRMLIDLVWISQYSSILVKQVNSQRLLPKFSNLRSGFALVELLKLYLWAENILAF